MQYYQYLPASYGMVHCCNSFWLSSIRDELLGVLQFDDDSSGRVRDEVKTLAAVNNQFFAICVFHAGDDTCGDADWNQHRYAVL